MWGAPNRRKKIRAKGRGTEWEKKKEKKKSPLLNLSTICREHAGKKRGKERKNLSFNILSSRPFLLLLSTRFSTV